MQSLTTQTRVNNTLCSLLQELELLSVRESVELLSTVAQLDTSEVSPCMIEIVRVDLAGF